MHLFSCRAGGGVYAFDKALSIGRISYQGFLFDFLSSIIHLAGLQFLPGRPQDKEVPASCAAVVWTLSIAIYFLQSRTKNKIRRGLLFAHARVMCDRQ